MIFTGNFNGWKVETTVSGFTATKGNKDLNADTLEGLEDKIIAEDKVKFNKIPAIWNSYKGFIKCEITSVVLEGYSKGECRILYEKQNFMDSGRTMVDNETVYKDTSKNWKIVKKINTLMEQIQQIKSDIEGQINTLEKVEID